MIFSAPISRRMLPPAVRDLNRPFGPKATPTASQAMAAGGEASAAAACWTASTSWIPSRGSLRDAISFDSSSPDTATPISGGILLLRPPSDDPPPCRVTVCFREKHEIHRVYVRSTARVYEIYYSSGEQSSSNEYLCTVHCGATSEEAKLPREADGATDCQIGNAKTSSLPDQMSTGSSTSEEDGWVDVEVPDSLQDDQANSLSNVVDKEIGAGLQMHYEATAEISDASPCLSLTLLLLSLETNTCVHIEEIYIFADPVESTHSIPSISTEESLGGDSLFTMLLPSLLQLPKSDARRIFYDDVEVNKYLFDTEKAADKSRKKQHPVETTSSITEWQSGLACETRATPAQTPTTDSHHVSDYNQMPNSVGEENTLAYNRIEKVLDELVSRVERIERFCSRFEQNMMKPISCIEGCLQRLVQQLDTARVQSSKSFPSLKVSVPQFLSDDIDAEDKVCSPYHAAREDSKFAELPSPLTDVTASVPVPQIYPSLIFSAPEFSKDADKSNADDTLDLVVEDCPKTNTPSSSGSTLAKTNSIIKPVAQNISKDKKSSAVDSALASTLASLMSSTTITSPGSPRLNPSLMEESSEISHFDNTILASSSAGVTPELAGETFNNCDAENNSNEISHVHNKILGSTIVVDPKLAGRTIKNCNVQNNDCVISCEVKCTDFVDSSLTADVMEAPLSSSAMHPGLLITTEFPSEHDDYINCNDNSSDAVMKYGLGATGLAAYRSSGMDSITSELVGKTLDNSDVQGKGCGIYNEVKISDFVDSYMSADVVEAPVFDSRKCPGLLIAAPEFPSERDGFIDSDGHSFDPGVKNSVSTSGLAAYLLSRMTNSSSHSQSLIDVASEGANFNNNKLASCSVQVPCKADKQDTEKHGNTVNQVLLLDSAFKLLLPNQSRRETDTIEQRYGSMELPAEGSCLNSMASEDSYGQECHTKWHEEQITTEPTEVKKFADNYPYSKVKNVNQKWHDGGCADDSDAEEDAYRGPTLDFLSRGWIEDVSSYSNVDKTFIIDEVRFDCSNGGNAGSVRLGSVDNELNKHNAAIHKIIQAIDDVFVSHHGVEPSAGVHHENSKPELKSGDNSMLEFFNFDKARTDLEHEASASQGYEHSPLDVNFAQESNWRSRDPLEVLQDEQASAVDADVHVSVVNVHESNPSPFRDAEDGGLKIDRFLWEL